MTTFSCLHCGRVKQAQVSGSADVLKRFIQAISDKCYCRLSLEVVRGALKGEAEALKAVAEHIGIPAVSYPLGEGRERALQAAFAYLCGKLGKEVAQARSAPVADILLQAMEAAGLPECQRNVVLWFQRVKSTEAALQVVESYRREVRDAA